MPRRWRDRRQSPPRCPTVPAARALDGFRFVRHSAARWPDGRALGHARVSLPAPRRAGDRGLSGLDPVAVTLERDDFSSNRHLALTCTWSMIFSENRYPLFGIML